ncbi:Uncharacterised protein [Citrobacter koseri]|nr:Uncharacterised protein [Citrobacter koseri]STT20851.1 Uncharacterised protein [Citrobacter koseri]SUX84679.1 Uncharacterised protein [Citrobacter koseri]
MDITLIIEHNHISQWVKININNTCRTVNFKK